MGFEAQILVVLIASPGDTVETRDLVERAIASWNRDRSRSRRVALLPARWETDAVPELGDDAQAAINRQLVDDADVVIALFHSRLGAPTERAASGTAEDIERAVDRDTPVHVYFSEMPVPRSVDPDELKRLNQFRADLQARGLIGTYASDDDLAAKVRTALERDVELLVSVAAEDGDLTEPSSPRAVLRVQYDYDREPHVNSRGKMTMRSRRHRLVVQNLGTAPAENVELNIEAVGQGEAPILHIEGPIEVILPQSAVTIMAMVHLGVATQWRVTMRWQEAGEIYEEMQTVTAM